MQAAGVMTSDILINRLIQTETVRAAHCGPIDPGPTRYMAPSCNKLFDVFLQTLSACMRVADVHGLLKYGSLTEMSSATSV